MTLHRKGQDSPDEQSEARACLRAMGCGSRPAEAK